MHVNEPLFRKPTLKLPETLSELRVSKIFFVVSRVCGLSGGSIVVRQFVYCERLRDYRADVSC